RDQTAAVLRRAGDAGLARQGGPEARAESAREKARLLAGPRLPGALGPRPPPVLERGARQPEMLLRRRRDARGLLPAPRLQRPAAHPLGEPQGLGARQA